MALTPPKFVEEIGARLAQLAANSPVADIEKNVRALLTGALGHLDIVTREEFDIQRDVLRHTRKKLEALEQRVQALEARFGVTPPVQATATEDTTPFQA